MKYIYVNLYRKMLDCAFAEGMQRNDFITLPTPVDAIEHIRAVPADHFFELHEFLDDKLGPGFSVRVGRQMKIEDYGVLGLSWRTCSYAGEIFARSKRYFKLLSNTYLFNVEKGKNTSTIYLNREPYRRGVELSNEATLSATVVVLKAMTESEISPTQVTFKHNAPKDLSSFRNAFNCPLFFNQPHYSITYRTSDLEMRTAKADASINNFLIERVKEETEGLEIPANKFIDDVERLIRDALPSGIPAIRQIGKLIGMSSRTLARRLSENGVTYRDLIRKVQEETAKDLLKNNKRSIAQIAFETGFSEQSAFNRAFKRWTGLPPFEFRKKL